MYCCKERGKSVKEAEAERGDEEEANVESEIGSHGFALVEMLSAAGGDDVVSDKMSDLNG